MKPGQCIHPGPLRSFVIRNIHYSGHWLKGIQKKHLEPLNESTNPHFHPDIPVVYDEKVPSHHKELYQFPQSHRLLYEINKKKCLAFFPRRER